MPSLVEPPRATSASLMSPPQNIVSQTSSSQTSSELVSKPRFGLGGILIKEDELKVDLTLLDKYQGFSAELVRLTLLGIAAFGFLFKEVASEIKNDEAAKWWFSISVISFACSTAAALFHRYYSTDSLACQIRYMRLKQREKIEIDRGSSAPSEAASHSDPSTTGCEASIEQIREEKNNERTVWHRNLNWSARSLAISALLLSLGAFCLAVTFIKVLF